MPGTSNDKANERFGNSVEIDPLDRDINIKGGTDTYVTDIIGTNHQVLSPCSLPWITRYTTLITDATIALSATSVIETII